jgi:hypothetical protein
MGKKTYDFQRIAVSSPRLAQVQGLQFLRKLQGSSEKGWGFSGSIRGGYPFLYLEKRIKSQLN